MLNEYVNVLDNELYSNSVSKMNYNTTATENEYTIIDTAVSKKMPENYVDMEKLQYNDYISIINNKNNEYNIRQ